MANAEVRIKTDRGYKFLTYQEWKAIKSINGEDNQKIIRSFEKDNPGLAALFARKEQEEQERMRQIMKEPDRMERWKQIAQSAYAYDPEHMARRQREHG